MFWAALTFCLILSNSSAEVYFPDFWKWNEREQLKRKPFNPFSVLELSLEIAFAI